MDWRSYYVGCDMSRDAYTIPPNLCRECGFRTSNIDRLCSLCKEDESARIGRTGPTAADLLAAAVVGFLFDGVRAAVGDAAQWACPECGDRNVESTAERDLLISQIGSCWPAKPHCAASAVGTRVLVGGCKREPARGSEFCAQHRDEGAT